jgi:exosome complex RNA-binding protein Csl4
LKAEELVVVPGDRLSTEEEHSAGANAYAEDGYVYAAACGSVEIKDRSINVRPLKEMLTFQPGMKVLGKVTESMKSVVFIEISKINDGKKEYVPKKDGKIIIMKDRRGFGDRNRGRPQFRERDESEEKPCKKGDVIIANVIAEEKDIYLLGVAGPEAGVIYSKCGLCGEMLKKGDRPSVLLCNNCRRAERRKVSTLYGNPKEIKNLFSQ